MHQCVKLIIGHIYVTMDITVKQLTKQLIISASASPWILFLSVFWHFSWAAPFSVKCVTAKQEKK